MRSSFLILIGLLAPAGLAGCSVAPADTAAVNVGMVVERVSKTLDQFDSYLRRYDYKSIDQPMKDQFNATIQHDLNAAPRFHPTKIVTTMQKDASIMGYGDLNGNGKVDEKEPKLFKIEFDADNSRVIVTAATNNSAVGRPMVRSGFFTGVMMGSLLNSQANAGIKHGHFSGRNVAGAPAVAPRRMAATRTAARGSTVRSAARSGGIRAGK